MLGWTHLRDTTPHAKREYQCYLCLKPIAVGEKHVCRAGIFYGEIDLTRMHIECEAATRDWDDNEWETFHPTGGPGWQEILEDWKR